jgi:hypothetical protein
MSRCICFRIFCSALLFLVFSSKVSAQQPPETATVCGIVQDWSGAGIPGVLAELRSADGRLTTKTDPGGRGTRPL